MSFSGGDWSAEDVVVNAALCSPSGCGSEAGEIAPGTTVSVAVCALLSSLASVAMVKSRRFSTGGDPDREEGEPKSGSSGLTFVKLAGVGAGVRTGVLCALFLPDDPLLTVVPPERPITSL